MDSLPPILNPPSAGSSPTPAPSAAPKRHGCLTTWLVLMLFLEAKSVLTQIGMNAIGGSADLSSLTHIAPEPSWCTWGIAALAGLDIVCVIFLFMWKKWAFYGSALAGVGVMVLTLAAQGSLGSAISGLVLPGVLYFVLQLGGENRGWRRLR